MELSLAVAALREDLLAATGDLMQACAALQTRLTASQDGQVHITYPGRQLSPILRQVLHHANRVAEAGFECDALRECWEFCLLLSRFLGPQERN